MTKIHDEIILTSLVVEDDVTFTLTEIRQRFSIDANIIDDMLEHGLIDAQNISAVSEMRVDQQALQRIQRALHLYHDLGVNIAGAALVLDVLDELATVRCELSILRHHVSSK
jgi:chaperone modulatory protein CbpM